MNTPTPTESLIGFDANGIPDRHTSPASRQHTDQHDDTTRIIAPDRRDPPVAYRCACCGWTYAKDASEGCVPGNCSQRPLPERKYDPERYASETTRIILPGPQLPPQAIRQSVSQAEILRASGYVPPAVQPHYDLPHRDDLAYMAPEAVEAMLRRCNHVCRTHGCGAVVALCGSFCEDCQGGIDAQREARMRPAKPALWRRLWRRLTSARSGTP